MIIMRMCCVVILCSFLLTAEISTHNKHSANNYYISYDYYDNSQHFFFCLIVNVLIAAMELVLDALLPFRQYLLSVKYLCAEEEKNYIRDKGSAGDDPDSCGIQAYYSNFGGDINSEQGDYYKNTL
jgi:hypothetical protein